MRDGLEPAIARSLAYAPYADVIWFETSTPDLEEARRFADAIHERHPRKLLAYNCSPSFNWRQHLSDAQIASFQQELGSMGYRFQFVTLAGFHALNESMFELARGYARSGMSAYVELQEREFALEESGYTATRHQREVGAGYFDGVLDAVTGGEASTRALEGSTEEAQFTRDGFDRTTSSRRRRSRSSSASSGSSAASGASCSPPARSGRRGSTPASGRTSSPRRGTCARATGACDPRPPTSRTAASRSPARSSGR